METVRKNKVFLIDTLSSDASIVLQYAQSTGIITTRDYNNLNQPNHTQEKIIISLLDKVMNRGDGACLTFLKLLEKEEFQEIFPQLKERFTPDSTPAERENGPATARVTQNSKGAEFVDNHRRELIQRMTSVMEIADGLLSKRMITGEQYSTVRRAGKTGTTQDQMRELYESLDAGGRAVKEEFYTILKDKQPYLVQDLESE